MNDDSKPTTQPVIGVTDNGTSPGSHLQKGDNCLAQALKRAKAQKRRYQEIEIVQAATSPDDLWETFRQQVLQARAGDRDSATWIWDRYFGKPKSVVDIQMLQPLLNLQQQIMGVIDSEKI